MIAQRALHENAAMATRAESNSARIASMKRDIAEKIQNPRSKWKSKNYFKKVGLKKIKKKTHHQKSSRRNT